jgi:hypothetical protein
MKVVPHQFAEGAVRVMDQRTGRFHDLQTLRPRMFQRQFRSAVRGNHYGFGFDSRDFFFHMDAAGAQIGKDRLVMRQFSENRDRSTSGFFNGQGNGVANAEAHAKVAGADYFDCGPIRANSVNCALHCKVRLY